MKNKKSEKNETHITNIPNGNPDDIDFLNSSSAMDCTGLIPAAPTTLDEYEAYNDVYNFRPRMVSAEEDSLKNPVSKINSK